MIDGNGGLRIAGLVVVCAITFFMLVVGSCLAASAAVVPEHTFSFWYSTSGDVYGYNVICTAVSAESANLLIKEQDGTTKTVELASTGGGNFSCPSGGYGFERDEPIQSLAFYVDGKWVAGAASYEREDGTIGYSSVSTAPDPIEIPDPAEHAVYLPVVSR